MTIITTTPVHPDDRSSRNGSLYEDQESFREAPVVSHVVPILEHTEVDPVFEAKCHLLNDTVQAMGWGKYQTQLFLLAGFGWFVDNMFLAAVSATLPVIRMEFNPPQKGVFLGLGQQVGLLLGAFVFGLGSDVIGRSFSFNITLLIVGVCGMTVAAGPNYVGVAALMGLTALGIGGNMPIDSAVFLEFCPQKHQYMLTILSIFWSMSSAFLALLAWPFLLYFSCPLDTPWGTCPRSKNMGWRYLYITIAGLTLTIWTLRFFLFKLHESPKYLLARNRDADAVAIIDAIAKHNGKENHHFTIDRLEQLDIQTRLEHNLPLPPKSETAEEVEKVLQKKNTAKKIIKTSLSVFSGSRIKSLFATKKLAISTSMVILLWITLSISWNTYNFFLPVFIANQGIKNGDGSLNTTYRNYAMIGICQIPGSLIGGWLVERKRLGRKGALALASFMSGLFLFGYTQAKTQNASLGFQCASAVMQNIIWGVLYTYTPEIFPSPQRGTGMGICSCASNAAALFVPVLGYYSNVGKVTIWACGGCFIFASFLVSALPLESMGKASM